MVVAAPLAFAEINIRNAQAIPAQRSAEIALMELASKFVPVTIRYKQRRPPEMNTAVNTCFITGLASVGDRMLILMAIEALKKSTDMGLIDVHRLVQQSLFNRFFRIF